MKKDKFCFSRTLVYLVMILVLGVGLFWGVKYMNSQKMGSKPKAGGSCLPKKCLNDLNIARSDSERSVYVKYVSGQYKYYKDSNCKYEATEGVATFCRQDITKSSTCIDVSWLYPDCKRPVYKKDLYGTGKYFLFSESSCQKLIADDNAVGFWTSPNADANEINEDNERLLASTYCSDKKKLPRFVGFLCSNVLDKKRKNDTFDRMPFYYYYDNSLKKYLFYKRGFEIHMDESNISDYCKVAYFSATNEDIYPTNITMNQLFKFMCSDLTGEKNNKRFVYANLEEFYNEVGDDGKTLNEDIVHYYKDSWKQPGDVNRIYDVVGYCKNLVNITPTSIISPTPST